MNPVIFAAWEQKPGFIALSRQLGEFDCKDKLVGLTDEGILYADRKTSRLNHYEFSTAFLPWQDVEHVDISRCLGVKGLLFGALITALGGLAAYGLWRKPGDDWAKLAEFALVGLLGGPVFIVGAWRNRIRVRAGTRTFTWTCPPLGYGRSLADCEHLTSLCVEHRIENASHVSESFLHYR